MNRLSPPLFSSIAALSIALGLVVGCGSGGGAATDTSPIGRDILGAVSDAAFDSDSVGPLGDAGISELQDVDAIGVDGEALADISAPDDVVSHPNRDINGSVPEVNISAQPLGGVCANDAQCVTGMCLTSYSGGYCTQLCENEDDCPDGGACFPDPSGQQRVCWMRCEIDDDCRTDQFCAASAGLCVPRCREGECKHGYTCDITSGQCEFVGFACVPEEEICDERDNDCDRIIDEGCGVTTTAPDSVGVIDLGKIYAGGNGLTREMTFDIPDGTASFMVVVVAQDDGLMVTWRLRSPSGELLVDGDDLLASPNRTFPQDGTYTLMVPDTPRVELEPGEYAFTLYKEGERGFVDAMVLLKRAPVAATGTLDLNLYFVGTDDLDAASAQQSSRFQRMFESFSSIYAAAGISVGRVRYLDIPEEAASHLAILDIDTGGGDTGGGSGEMAELLRLSGVDDRDDGLNIFFVKAIQTWGVLGVAGGIPGPPFVQSTPHSGVVVSLQDYLTGWGGSGTLAEVIAHEVGHQLGLYHVSEQDGSMHDPLDDTPECVASDDWNGDGAVDSWECDGKGADNLMFWAASDGATISSDQSWVLRRNVQIHE